MHLPQPDPPLFQSRVRVLAHILLDRCIMIGQRPARPAALPARSQPPIAVAPLARLDHV
jgi:hypothetical protein